MKIEYYSRYLKLNLELSTLTKEIEVLKKQQDRLSYGGVHDISAVDYSKERGSIKVESITNFYNDLVEITKLIRSKEEIVKELQVAIKGMEQEFKTYASKCDDFEMKVFIEVYVYGKKIKDVYIKKNEFEFYSERQIKRIHERLKEKIKNEN